MLNTDIVKMSISGNQSIMIALRTWRPKSVSVFFIDHPIPCEHPHHDHLAYELKKEHYDKMYYLFIEWRVHGIREIEYIVHY